MARNNTVSYAQISDNVQAAVTGTPGKAGAKLLIEVDLSGKPEASSTGKMLLFGTTGGWQDVGAGIRFNTMVGRRAKKA